MQTHLVEIIEDVTVAEESWASWATRNVKENGWKVAGAAVIVSPIIPVGVGAVAVGAGLVSGVQNGVAWWRGSDAIEKREVSNAAALQDERGLPVQIAQIYAIHPDDSRPNLAIIASEFHNVIVSEQIADLVSFIRGAVRALSIHIEVESEGSGKIGGGLLSRFSVTAEGGVTKHHSVELRYDDPEVVVCAEQPFWLCLFPEIVAAFRGAQKGSIKRIVSVDTTFGLNATVAEKAGIDTSWLGRQRFIVEASFA
jgi:hypothetical protein